MTTHRIAREGLERRIRLATGERLSTMRNMAYGAAAACLAILLSLSQVNITGTPLRVCAYSASASLPLWLLYGGMYEYYIFLGKDTHAHLAGRFSYLLSTSVLLAASLCLLVAAAALIYFIVPGALWVFVAVALLCIVLGWRFHMNLALWLSRSSEQERIDA